MSKDRCRGKGFLESLEGIFTVFIEYKQDVFTGQLYKGGNNLREVGYKSLIEISKSNQGANVLYV